VGWPSRWRGRKPVAPAREPAPAPEASETPATPPEAEGIERLFRAGEPGGASVEEALAMLRALRAGPDEATALEGLVQRSRLRPLPEPLAVAAASALVERGEAAVAERLLGDASSREARVLLADLRADRGELTGALAMVERVLLHDLDYPGAADRHRKWRSLLGLEDAPRKPTDAGATLATSKPDAPFRLLREVARGGSGAVYEAEDRDLGRRVALKVYHRADRDRTQLIHEARVAVTLAGPGIVRVFDVQPDQGWVALEFASLGALRELVRSRSRELVPFERWALPLALGLSRVHAAGWVHHDVKPANVLLRSLESPVLADFGTARRVGEASPPGSLGYVSPERMAGRRSDPKDDVYGFGRVLEDALEALGDAELRARWRPLVAACIGADAGRPADARALLIRLRVEPGQG
jgi:serine/threonine-protein kinase